MVINPFFYWFIYPAQGFPLWDNHSLCSMFFEQLMGQKLYYHDYYHGRSIAGCVTQFFSERHWQCQTWIDNSLGCSIGSSILVATSHWWLRCRDDSLMCCKSMNSWTWCSTMLRITQSDHSWLGNSSCIAALNFFDESRASYLSLGKSRYLQLCPLAKQCCSLTWWMVQKTNTASIHFLAYPPVSSCTWLVLSCWTLQGWLNHQPVLYGRHRCTHLDVGAPGRGGVGTGTGAGANGFEWLWYGFSWFFCIFFFFFMRGWFGVDMFFLVGLMWFHGFWAASQGFCDLIAGFLMKLKKKWILNGCNQPGGVSSRMKQT